jgi:quercetin dioxygenase-like cupin family protein
MGDGAMQGFRLAEADWQARRNPVTGEAYHSARLVKDAETGAEAILVRYPAGAVTPDHTHPCAHGLVVLSGQLLTQGGVFGPGDVVWYPEGSIGHHGATAAAEVTALVFSNKAFGITYLTGEGAA